MLVAIGAPSYEKMNDPLNISFTVMSHISDTMAQNITSFNNNAVKVVRHDTVAIPFVIEQILVLVSNKSTKKLENLQRQRVQDGKQLPIVSLETIHDIFLWRYNPFQSRFVVVEGPCSHFSIPDVLFTTHVNRTPVTHAHLHGTCSLNGFLERW